MIRRRLQAFKMMTARAPCGAAETDRPNVNSDAYKQGRAARVHRPWLPEAATRGRQLGVNMAFPQFPGHRVNVFEPLAASHKQPDSRSLTSSVDDVDCRSTQCN
jgi:hypothetical protein